MSIKYKSENGNIITNQQLQNVEAYYKSFEESGVVFKEEFYSRGELMGLIVYNHNFDEHQTIINSNLSTGYKWFAITEFLDYSSGFKLEKNFFYNTDGVFEGNNLALFNPQGKLIAHGSKDENGNYDYYRTRKFYFDSSINNSDEELFECTYKDNGELWELYWNNNHINDLGQDSIVLWDTPEDRQILIDLSGMSNELVDYYMSSEIEPNF